MGGYYSTSSQPVDQKTGSEWTYELYFDPRADEKDNHIYRIKAKDLKKKFAELVDVKKAIKNVEAFRHPLFDWQVTQELSHHLYIVFDTEYWWWSIEKDTEGITIMRSREKKWVRDYYKRKSRTTGLVAGIEFVKSDKGNKTVEELIDWLYDQDELNKVYNVYTSNCQHFAERVFDLLAKEKKLYTVVLRREDRWWYKWTH